MSDFGSELVIPMPPVRMSAIESVADAFLEELCPDALYTPMMVPVVDWVDHGLPAMNIHVAPAHEVHIAGAEGLTDPSGRPGDGIDILIRWSDWDALLAGGRRAHRPRATVAHEVGHAALHVPTIRRRQRSPNANALLRQVQRKTIETYRCPEWQAWAFAGCILAPRSAITLLPKVSIDNVAETFGMSTAFAEKHLRRLHNSRPLRWTPPTRNRTW